MLWQDLGCAVPGGALGALGWCAREEGSSLHFSDYG